MPASPRRRFAAIGFGALLAIAPVWIVRYPPMVDLAQHAAQLSIWLRWSESGMHRELLQINWLAPHMAAPTLVFLLAQALPLLVALKLVISISILGIPVATAAWVRELDGDPAWAWLTLPLGYGFAFFWGFINYSLAVPIALSVLLLGWRYLADPSLRRGTWLTLSLHVLFFTHVIACGYTGLVLGLLTLCSVADVRSLLRRLWPLVATLPVIVGWVLLTRSLDQNTTPVPSLSGLGLYRLPELPALVLGMRPAPLYVLLGLAFLLAPFASGVRPSREPRRWIPFAVSCLLFLLAARTFFGTAFLYQRFAVFLLPTLLIALERAPGPRRFISVYGPPLLASTWLLVTVLRFYSFGRESAGLDQVIDNIPPERRVLSMVLQPTSEFVPWPVYLHFPTWYQVERGGMVDFSFAEFLSNRFRYRKGMDPDLPAQFEWNPLSFRWSEHAAPYDSFVVRSPADPAGLFAEGLAQVDLAAQEGSWWLYRRRVPSSTRELDPVLERKGE